MHRKTSITYLFTHSQAISRLQCVYSYVRLQLANLITREPLCYYLTTIDFTTSSFPHLQCTPLDNSVSIWWLLCRFNWKTQVWAPPVRKFFSKRFIDIDSRTSPWKILVLRTWRREHLIFLCFYSRNCIETHRCWKQAATASFDKLNLFNLHIYLNSAFACAFPHHRLWTAAAAARLAALDDETKRQERVAGEEKKKIRISCSSVLKWF